MFLGICVHSILKNIKNNCKVFLLSLHFIHLLIRIMYFMQVYHLLNAAVLMIEFIPDFAEQAASRSLLYHTEIRPLIRPVALNLLLCSSSTNMM